MKVRKSILKRFKFTKKGKVLHLPVGQNHFRAKKRSKTKRQKRKLVPLSKSLLRALRRYLYFTPRKKKKK